MSSTAELDPRDVEVATPPKRRRRRRWIIAILALLGLVIVLALIKFIQIKTMIDAGKAAVPPPESVTSYEVKPVGWQPLRSAVGTLVAVRGVTLSAEVTGTVRQIDFENGAAVHKGDLLVRLDDSSDQAQLAGARAEAVLAKQNLERARRLRSSGVNTASDLQAAEARDAQARATVNNLQAVIAKKVIRAPFDGRVGIRAVELGQVIAPGTPIVSLQTVSPILVEFQLPQQALAEIQVGQKVELTVDVFPGQKWDGKVSVINPQIDPATRTVRMRATVDNPDGRLKPGMFASVEIQTGAEVQALIIPQTSVVFAPYGDSVFVIQNAKEGGEKAPLVASQRFIRLGDRRGDFVAVTSGLDQGETVVSNGAFKLHNGQSVVVNNKDAPTPKLNPQPVDE